MSGNFWPCLLALTVLTLAPGVDTLLVLRNSVRGGWRDGVVSSLGICSGLFVHALLSALGISVLLLQSAQAFQLLKLLGAGYLVWLGICSLRSAAFPPQFEALAARAQTADPDARSAVLHNAEALAARAQTADLQLSRSLREGLLSNVLNPKTIIFYMAFLPQFISPSGAVLPQSLAIAALHFVLAMSYQSALALLVARSARWWQNRRLRRSLDGVSGTLLVLFGLRLGLGR